MKRECEDPKTYQVHLVGPLVLGHKITIASGVDSFSVGFNMERTTFWQHNATEPV
jgi:hypothetical protein